MNKNQNQQSLGLEKIYCFSAIDLHKFDLFT